MIDYFCLFTNQAAAIADPTVGAFWSTKDSDWIRAKAFPNTIVNTPAALVNGISTVTGFWIVISQTSDNPALDAVCVMSLDRDAGVNNGNFILSAVGALNGVARRNLTFSPTPHGSHYPHPLGK